MGTTCGFERLKLKGQQTIEGGLVAACRFCQTLGDRLLERLKVFIVFAVETFFAHEAPQALNQIEIGRIGWQKEQFDAHFEEDPDLGRTASDWHSPWRIFSALRFQAARRLLLTTSLSVTDICVAFMFYLPQKEKHSKNTHHGTRMTTMPTTSNINARQNKHHNPKNIIEQFTPYLPKNTEHPIKAAPSWSNQQSAIALRTS